MDSNIINEMKKGQLKDANYEFYFYPEIKKFNDNQNKTDEFNEQNGKYIDIINQKDFNKKRLIGDY